LSFDIYGLEPLQSIIETFENYAKNLPADTDFFCEQIFPNFFGVKLWQHFHSAADSQRSQQAVDDAVNVMEGQNVEKAVLKGTIRLSYNV
jgi:hypothetical protein